MIAGGRQAFVALVVATVVVSVIGGLLLLGSPRKERERRLDERRVAEMRAIANAVDWYWTRHGRLPDSFADLSREQAIQVNPLDPETQQPYDYRVLGVNSYELCATFARNAAEEDHVPQGGFWAHGSGSQCFRLEPKAVKR